MTSELKNDRLLRALHRQRVDRTPVWIMRQAGRYLPEYRELRQQAGSFMGLASNPELACEVTLQPLRRFPLDAAILFSDILTVPDAMGLGLYFVEGEGPKFERPLRDAAAIRALPRPDPVESLGYVMQAVGRIRAELQNSVPLIGFAGSPWTLATYMIEGGSSRDFARAKALLYEQPGLAHELLGKLADAVTDYLNAQVEHGAQVLQIFDSWGGALAHEAFREFSLRYLARIIEGLHREWDGRPVPVILFAKGCNGHLEALADTGADALGIDWTMPMGEARRRVGQRVALQGNLDPAILLTPPDNIRAQARACLDSFGPGPGQVFNLGHGITPDVPPEHLATLVEEVQAYSPGLHQPT